MTSYRHALSTACYLAAIVCFLAGTMLLWKFAPGVFAVTILFIGAVALLVLAIKFDERL